MPALYDPLFQTPQDDLYDVYRELRYHHPVYHNVERDVWCIARHGDVQAAARDWKTFSNADGVDLDTPRFYGQGDFLDSDPPRHDVLRDVVRPVFIPKAVAKLEAAIAGRVDEIIAGLHERSEADLARDFAWRLPIWVICRLLGIPSSDDGDVQRLVTTLSTKQPGDPAPSAIALSAVHELRGYLSELGDFKRRCPRNDLLTRLVQGRVDGAPTADELPGLAVLLFVAGSETTASLLANSLHLLWRYPAIRDGLHVLGQCRNIDGAIEEILRFETPVQYLGRVTTKSVTVSDVEIPAGARVALLYGSANRDENRWVNADTFDVHRERLRHLAFGEGIHFCLGSPLARLEARVALPAFLRAFPDYEIALSAQRSPSHIIRGFAKLPASLKGSRVEAGG
jgi:cytochrome P450